MLNTSGPRLCTMGNCPGVYPESDKVVIVGHPVFADSGEPRHGAVMIPAQIVMEYVSHAANDNSQLALIAAQLAAAGASSITFTGDPVSDHPHLGDGEVAIALSL